MRGDDDEEEWEWTAWQEQKVPDRDNPTITVEFEPTEPDVLELPDGSEIWFYPKFGFMRDH